jgi:predicted transcriptional regulator
MTVREERAKRALVLRRRGWKLREIAEELGVAISTVSAWCTDPDGSRLAARKNTYRGICTGCGKKTDGSNGSKRAPSLCQECRKSSPEAILATIRDWTDTHGRPPRKADLNGTTAARYFGTWNNALLAAGVGLNHDRRRETQERLESLIAEGHTLKEAAGRVGLSPACVSMRLRYRGLSVADLRRAA